MCLLASQEQMCLTSAKILSLASFTLLRGSTRASSGVWLLEDKQAFTIGSNSKRKTIPSNLHRAKKHFSSPHLVYFGPLLKSVRTLSYLDHRQGLKFNMSDMSNQCCLWWENIWEVSLKTVLLVGFCLSENYLHFLLITSHSHRYHTPANMKPLAFSASPVQRLKLVLLWLLHSISFSFNLSSWTPFSRCISALHLKMLLPLQLSL